MPTRQRRQSRLRPLLVPLGCLLVLAYFAYHAVEGEFGLYALERLEAEEQALSEELLRLRDARAQTEKRVALMRPESLDPDVIDEQARQALNLAHPHDVVLFLPEGGTPQP